MKERENKNHSLSPADRVKDYHYLGVESTRSKDYILAWKGTVEALDEHFDVIQKTAGDMIRKIEEVNEKDNLHQPL